MKKTYKDIYVSDKTKKEKNSIEKSNIAKKAICFITVAAMAITCFYSDGFTVETEAAGAVSYNGSTYTLTGIDGQETFTLSDNGSGLVLSFLDEEDVEQEISIETGKVIHASADADLILDSTVESEVNITVASGCVASIEGSNTGTLDNEGGIISVSGSNDGDILNHFGEMSITGSVSGSSFDNWDVLNIMTDDFDMDELKNSNVSAEIHVSDFTMDSTVSGTGYLFADNLVIDGCDAGIVVTATNSLKVSSGTDYGPSIKVAADTLVTSEGGIFTLQIEGEDIHHIDAEWFEDKTAAWAYKATPDVNSVGGVSIFYGTEYNMKNYFTTSSDGEVSVMYADFPEGSEEPGLPYSEQPTEVATYRAYYYVAETDTYRDIDGYSDDFEIRYLTKSDASDMDAELDGTYTTDGTYRYYNTPVTVTPNTGFTMYLTYPDEGDETFKDQCVINDDGYYNGVMGVFRRSSDNATSNSEYFDYAPFYVDQLAPEVDKSTVVDENGDTPDVDPVDGAEFHAKKIEFDIHDIWGSEESIYGDALSSVTVNGEEVPVGDGIAHVEMSTTKGTKSYDIVATDKAGNVSSMTLSIEYKKTVPTTSLAMSDSYYGAALATPVVTTDSDQDESEYKYYYKKKGADDETYSETKPTEVGSYTVKVEIPFTDEYAASQAEADFKISYLDAPEDAYTVSGTEGKNGYYTSDVSLSAPDGYQISTSANGDFGESVQYDESIKSIYLKRSSDSALTDAVSVSKIWIDKTFPVIPDKAVDSDGYEIEIADGSTVKAKSLSFSVTDENLTSVTVNDQEFEVADGKSDVYIESRSGEALEVSIAAEDAAGNVTSRSFTLEKGTKTVPTATVTLGDYYVGQDYSPSFTSNSDGKDNVVFEYKYQAADDSAYSSDKPFAAGKYTVRATIPETDSFKGISCMDDFELSYLEAPKNAYTLTGKEGKNDYYISDVYVDSADGYYVGSTLKGSFGLRVNYTGSGQKIYLQRRSDGALTDAITVTEKCKIDKDLPVFEAGDNGKSISDKSSVYSDGYKVNVSDEHLAEFTVDGSPVKGKTANLDPENGTKTFALKAEDEAGNASTLSLTIAAEWLRDRVIPADKKLPLLKNEGYKLDGGHWSVSGDSTVYVGGRDVYVKTDGDYTFNKVD
ncbi:MAG: hypothetical protein K5865_02760 [Eubacterium sp.]|nr:hypothetical protein [Eubacterium sp.]